ncbi:MAG: ABC transporter permease [Saccharofermentans sp.]|nr:ABC transporter permease [Saccharofermentans sp.]
MIKTKHPAVFILLLSVMTVFMYGCDNALSDEQSNEYGNVYEVSEFVPEEQFDAYNSDDGTLFRRLLDYRSRLNDSSEFEFYAYANNFIEAIDIDIPEICIVNYGTEFEADSKYPVNGDNITATEAIQVSENFFDLFPVSITEGRCFQPTDFDCQNSETIPVIMGKAYQESFNPGDTFEGYYILERRTFEVIGFTDEESVFYLRSQNHMESYDHFIIMPFENIGEDSASARSILLQQICGFIVPNGDRDSALQTIQGYLNETGLEDWSEMIVVNKMSLRDIMN